MGNPKIGVGGAFLYILHVVQFSETLLISSFNSLFSDQWVPALFIRRISLSYVG